MLAAELNALLARAFDRLNRGLKTEIGKAEYERRRADFVFHMTDWLRDLEKLYTLYQHPSRCTPAAASTFLYGFLAHVIPHLRAAGRALDGQEFPDPFVATPISAPPSNKLA